MSYSDQFCGNKKLPKTFFVTLGSGESDHAMHSGAKRHAMKQASLHEYHLSSCPLLFSEAIEEIEKPETLVKGSRLRTILAEGSCETGEEASAGIITARLVRKTSGKEFGSLACDFGGKLSKKDLEVKLKNILDELYEANYANEYNLENIEYRIASVSPQKKFGAAVVALCFTEEGAVSTPHCFTEHRFLGYRCDLNKANYVLHPAAFDSNQKGEKGAREAPCAILSASLDLEPYHIETDQKTYLSGFYTHKSVRGASPVAIAEAVQKNVSETLKQGKMPIVIGGSHNTSIGSFYAMQEVYEKEFSILQLDASVDLRRSFDGTPYHSACTMTHARYATDSIMQVGIRSMGSSERELLNYDHIAFASDIHNDPYWVEDATSDLKKNVYITIDMSVFDPAYLQTAKPIPGGLHYEQVMKLLKEVARKHRVIGFDVTELIPIPGQYAGEFLAAKLIYDFISYIEAYKN